MAQVTFYEKENFRGRRFTTDDDVDNFKQHGFNNRVSSVIVNSGRWMACEDVRFEGRCVILSEGRYASLRQAGLGSRISSVRPVDGNEHRGRNDNTAVENASVTFYEGEGFRGRAFATDKDVRNFKRHGFNDSASSVIVERGHWEVCEDVRFQGRCVVLRQGSYDSLRRMGLENRVSSGRLLHGDGHHDNAGPEPIAAPNYEYRRRPEERVYEATVTSVRAVVGPPEQHCWVEQQQVVEPGRRSGRVGGTIIGAVIGGILGHQVGGGTGKKIATAGGAVAGAVVGSQVGGRYDTGSTTHERDVQRCENVPSGPPKYWDVTYNFRDVEHRIQMTAAPGRTISVNHRGEPRQ